MTFEFSNYNCEKDLFAVQPFNELSRGSTFIITFKKDQPVNPLQVINEGA